MTLPSCALSLILSLIFVALAPDLYRGKVTNEPDEAGKLMMAMRIDEAEKDLRAAAGYLAIQDSTTSEKIGACVVFYGGHPKVKPDLPNLHAPMLGLYADRDDFVTPDSVRELERKLKELGKDVQVKIYPDADHAFFNDARPEVYNAGAAADAWQRTVEFLRKNLR